MARLVPVLLFATLLSACGSSPAGNTTGTTGGATAGGTGTGGQCTPVQITGLVDFIQHDGVSPSGETVSASFATQAYAGNLDFGCNAACRFTPKDGGALPSGAFMDVGAVTASDTTTGTSQALGEQTFGSEVVYSSNALSWTFADMLQIAGGTGSFPAFSISVAAPAKITVLTPSTLAPGQTVVASQAAGLTITWAPSIPAATFMSLGIDTPAGQINCYPEDSAGTATITPAMLGNLAVGTYPTPIGLSFGRWNVVVDSLAGKTIGVQAEQFIAAGIQITP